MNKFSRRSFLKGAAGTAAAGALLSSGVVMAAEEEAAAEPDFGIAPVPVSEAGEPAYICDYLVIGAGNCGMMSAAHAAALGMGVIVLEKSATTGGSSVGTEVTQSFSDNKIMEECPSDPDVINMSQQAGTYKEIYTYFMMHNSWESNAQLVSNYIQTNGRVHDFLYENGAYPMMLLPSLDAPTNGIMYEGEGVGAFNVMQETAEKNGAVILTETPATALVVDEDGTVVGAMATIDGADAYIAAGAVFVGTGGFSNNAEMIEHFIPGYGTMAYKVDSFLCHDGDGIRMMLGAGAVPSDMSLAQPAGSSVPNGPWESTVDRVAREPYLWVDSLGERLQNEKWSTMDTTFKTNLKAKDYTYYNIVNQAAVDKMQEEGFKTDDRVVLGSSDPLEDMQADLDEAIAEGTIYYGETLEELAANAGIDAEGLAATMAHYNEMCAAGEDTQFFKDADYMISMEEGPYYAFPQIPAWYSTLCGVKINGNTEVIDADGYPIKGLYAGGLDSGEFFKDNYNHGFSGSCSGYSYFSGFFAAEQALAYLQA